MYIWINGCSSIGKGGNEYVVPKYFKKPENAVSKSGLSSCRPYNIFDPPLLFATVGRLTNK
jgi:hypothetical protein